MVQINLSTLHNNKAFWLDSANFWRWSIIRQHALSDGKSDALRWYAKAIVSLRAAQKMEADRIKLWECGW